VNHRVESHRFEPQALNRLLLLLLLLLLRLHLIAVMHEGGQADQIRSDPIRSDEMARGWNSLRTA
jgi:hypothetical protein